MKLQMKNHYDVLKLEKNCTEKEIKESFIKLSKIYHPDRNKGSEAHKMFVQVNEAYHVLSKSSSRLKYDESLTQGPTRVEVTYSSGKRVYPKYYENAYRSPWSEAEVSAYFSKSKLKAVLFCCMLMVIGAGLQIRHVWNDKKRRDQDTIKIAKALRLSRNKAKEMDSKQAVLNLLQNSSSQANVKPSSEKQN